LAIAAACIFDGWDRSVILAVTLTRTAISATPTADDVTATASSRRVLTHTLRIHRGINRYVDRPMLCTTMLASSHPDQVS
jgi:hypothetical protein